jgi:tetratricopeptide (TPR) repeat protein
MSTYEQTYSTTTHKKQTPSSDLCKAFLACTTFYAKFHITFIAFLFLQALSFLLFFSYFSKSATSAFAVALFLLSLFSYLILISFFQTKKPDQILSLKENFSLVCQKLWSTEIEDAQLHLKLAQESTATYSLLSQKEASFYTTKTPFTALNPLITKIKVKLHWKNFLAMKEQLLLLSIAELIFLIKKEPKDLEAHASLAETYFKMSELYLYPEKTNNSPLPWIPAEYLSFSMQRKHLSCAERAIQELQILQDYSSCDPWIHVKLAEIYHQMGKSEEEILQYEKIIETSADDEQVLFRLGVLYFEQGRSAKGLEIYEKLQKNLSKKADPLMSYYDSYPFLELSPFSSFIK